MSIRDYPSTRVYNGIRIIPKEEADRLKKFFRPDSLNRPVHKNKNNKDMANDDSVPNGGFTTEVHHRKSEN